MRFRSKKFSFWRLQPAIFTLPGFSLILSALPAWFFLNPLDNWAIKTWVKIKCVQKDIILAGTRWSHSEIGKVWKSKPHGWRKCSKSQARSIETEFSGRPLWGLQTCCCIIPSCWRALWCLSCWSTYRSRAIPTPLPFPELSSSPRLSRATWIWPDIASRRHRKWRDIVWRARAV